MDSKKDFIKSPWDFINELASDEVKENFELDEILVNISLKLINYRINKNITQKELSRRLDVSQAMVSKLESGDYNPSIEQLWKISTKLEWRFDVVFEEPTIETNIWDTNYTEYEDNYSKKWDELSTLDNNEVVLVEQYAEGA